MVLNLLKYLMLGSGCSWKMKTVADWTKRTTFSAFTRVFFQALITMEAKIYINKK